MAEGSSQRDIDLDALVADIGPAANPRLARTLLREAIGLIADDPNQLDLKIATAALTEMRDAFEMFEPYTDVPKVSIFGSARTQPDDPLYRQTELVARRLAEAGWMVVTGAGPGIMEAGMRGAGRDASIGVSIRLPFEAGANSIIAGDAKHVSMKYFFTRKLMLIKESAGFVCMPGGFGTLDETFELLTLTQTGKGVPVPIVLYDVASDEHPSYWGAVDGFIRNVLIPRRMVSPDDLHLYTLSSDPDVTVDEITGFYANYDSIRFVDNRLVIRMRRGPDPGQLATLNRQFAELVTDGEIETAEPSAAEIADDDATNLDRVTFSFNRRGFAELRAMIDQINTW